jgi:Putative beta-barrel porin-2, OmpL-like. bbp2
MKNLRLLIIGAFLLIITSNFAQDAATIITAANTPTTTTTSTTTPATTTTTPAKPAEGEEEEVNGKLTVSGYLDSYFFTNFNKPASRDNMGQSGVGRGFDRRVDQFSLGMVQTVFTYKNKKSEAVADLAFGPSAQYGNYGNVPNFGSAYGWAVGNDVFTAILIKQAYIKYNATDKLSFTMGQFGTHIGYEYIDAPLNFFYSINHTFNSGIPFYHTGLKATYAFSGKVSLMLGVVNGFDYVQDNNRSKGLIGQLSLAPAEGFTVYLNYINSNESNADATGKTPAGNFTVYDLNGGYQISEKFFVGYWAMYGTQKGELGSPGTFIPADGDVDTKKSWYGANLYLTYALTDKVSIGFRGEHFDNKSGARGLRNFKQTGDVLNPVQAIGATANTFTIGSTITLADGHLLLKPELRSDIFDKLKGSLNENAQQFMDSKGNFSKNSQTTLGMAAVYKF